jgi:Zn-dependent peptidase ImmA (M78 family)
MATTRIETLASKILDDIGIFRAPVNIKKVAEILGVRVKMDDFGEGISGFLVFKNGNGLIGINPDESRVRQRFTIAHELGHYNLHCNKSESFFVSKIHFRDEDSSTGEMKKEREANAFAAAILMPKRMLQEAIESIPSFYTEDMAIKSLAKKFDVSTMAMSIRLSKLGYISYL